jgi:intracellular sulfur oxidation DsrE/DsrF family protein
MRKAMYSSIFAASVIGLSFTSILNADEEGVESKGNNECPVDLVSGKTLNEEFGSGSQELTQCLERRHKVKVVVQINEFCRDNVPKPQCTRAYALGNIRNMIKDYETTHGMVQGRDYEIVAIVHSGGGWIVLKDEGYDGNGNLVTGRNQFEGQVRSLLDSGVKFYFCQNTTRGYISRNFLPAADETTYGATGEMIEGVGYTTAGITALVDYQRQGYMYVQP